MNSFFNYKQNVKSRSDLLTLLSEACEIEHGLACSYLYTAFSLKQSVDEGISAAQLHLVRKWASKIFFVASQEMLHLAQVWNLMNAIGGTPYYFRPNFPQTSKYYPFNLPLKLEPFSPESLKRFIAYELPSKVDEKEFVQNAFGFISEDDYSYKTVGELYGLIAEGFERLEDDLFIGDEQLQMGSDDIDFREIIKITDRRSALEAVAMITHQGEGNLTNRTDSHFGLFTLIEDEYRKELDNYPNFQPARNIVSDPITFLKGNYASSEGTLILNEFTRRASDLFDDIYNLMLRTLQFSFCCKSSDGKAFANYAILLMIQIVKPLGELLTLMPAFDEPFFKNAGASFSLNRHIPLPADLEIAKIVVRERGDDISGRLKEMKNGEFDRAFDEIAENFAAIHYSAENFAKDIKMKEAIELS